MIVTGDEDVRWIVHKYSYTGIFTAGDANIIVTGVTAVNGVNQIIIKHNHNVYTYSWR